MQRDAAQILDVDQLTDLSPQLRRAALYVIKHPDDVATRSLRHVAQAANLPPPTFSRLARAVGYDSYDALRETCRSGITQRKSQFADKALDLISGKAASDNDPFLVSYAAAAMRNTQTLLENIDPDRLQAAARQLADAGRVALVGSMSGRAFIDYAGYLADLALPDWNVIGGGSKGLAADLADLGETDAALVFSIEPYASATVDIVAALRDRAIPVIAITDSPLSPIADLAQTVFLISTESPQFFPSHVGATILIEMLMGMVVQQKGAEAQRRIAVIEQQSHDLRAYWQEPSATKTGKEKR